MGRHDRRRPTGLAGRLYARIPASAFLVAVLLFLGIGVLLYPTTASWFSALQQSRDVSSYGNSVEVLGPEGRSAALVAAREYNETLTGGAILDPFSDAPVGEDTAAGAQYQSQLALSPDDVMATLHIPSIGADLPIYHGTSDAVLRRGVGHLFGTALPVGGAGTHAVLTGHAGVPESTLFTNLDQVSIGDSVELDVYGEVLTYQVKNVEVILPTDTESLRPVAGEDLISLITCTPIGINTHRLVVTAERVAASPEAVAAGTAAAGIGFPWWAAGLGAGAAGSITVLLLAARRGKQREAS